MTLVFFLLGHAASLRDPFFCFSEEEDFLVVLAINTRHLTEVTAKMGQCKWVNVTGRTDEWLL